jgi:hypothetical protein
VDDAHLGAHLGPDLGVDQKAGRQADQTAADPAAVPVDPVPGDLPALVVDWLAGLADTGRFCLTIVRGIDEKELITRFGGEAAGAVPRTAAEATELETSWQHGYRPTVRVGTAPAAGDSADRGADGGLGGGAGERADGGFAFAVEQRHRQGAREETLRRVSAGTEAVAVAFDGIATEFVHAEDGVIQARMHSHWPDGLTGAGIERVRPLLADAGLLALDAGGYAEDDAEAAVHVALRLCPAAIDGEALAGPLLCAQVLPLLDDPPAEPAPPPVLADPDLAVAVGFAGETRLRTAVAGVLRAQADAAGLGDDAETSQALADADRREPRAVADDSPLGVLIRTLHAQAATATAAASDQQAPARPSQAEVAERARRAATAADVHALLARPAAVAAYRIVCRSPEQRWRADLLAALADVAVPPDALDTLRAAETARRAAIPRVRLREPKQPRPRAPRPAAPAAPLAAVPAPPATLPRASTVSVFQRPERTGPPRPAPGPRAVPDPGDGPG